jgi:phytoene dehydrogenase-like protein
MTPGAVMTSPLFTTLGARLEAVRALALLFGSRPGRFRQVTLQDWLNQYVTRLEVQQFVLALVRLSTYVNAPGLVSAGAILEQMQVGRKGVVYLHGGWQTLVDALEQQARRAGAGFRHDKVETADGRSLTLRSGETLAVDATILAVPPEAATELSGLTFAVNPVRAACLDVGLRRLPVPSHTFMLGVDQPHYFSVHSASARLAPPGLHVVHVARYLAPDEDEGHADDLEDVLDTMQPGWRDEVVERSFMPHLTVTADLPAAGRPRAGVRVSDSLCLAGDWVGSEAMLCDTALASAQAAVTAVTTQLGADVQHVS